MKFGYLVEICLWPHLAVKGLKVEFRAQSKWHLSCLQSPYCIHLQYQVLAVDSLTGILDCIFLSVLNISSQ